MEAWLVRLLNEITRWCRRRQAERQQPVIGDGWLLGVPMDECDGIPGTPVSITADELNRHCYVLGASGSGKSRLLEFLIRQHIQQDAGFCLVDPHGDLTHGLLAFLLAEYRAAEAEGVPFDLDRIFLVEPFQEDGVPGINPLDPCGGPLYPHLSELVAIFRRVWSSSWGPRMEEVMRNALLVLALAGLTLAELPALLTDAEFRTEVLGGIEDETACEYWRYRYDTLSDASRAAYAEPVLNKIGALLADPRLRCVLGQRDHCLNLRQLMDSGAWVFINCAKGQMRDASHLFGSFVVAQLQAAAMARADQPERDRVPFTLFVDEFQNFRGDDFETILCEARKYRLRLVLAHQHLEQVDGALRNAILGNVATQLVFAVSAPDAAVIGRQISRESNAGSRLIGQEVACAHVLRRGQAPAPVRIMPVHPPRIGESDVAAFAAQLRRQHGRPLDEVEAELRTRRRGVLGPGNQGALPPDTGADRLDARPDNAAPSYLTGDGPLQEADDA